MKNIEISIKELIVSILYHWLPIILAIALFIALFSAQGYLSQRNLMGKYEKKLFDAQTAAQQSIEDLNARKAAANEYFESSLQTNNMSIGNVTKVRFRINIDTKSDIYKVAQEYVSIFRKVSLRGILAHVLPFSFDEKLLRSMVVLNEEYGGLYNTDDPGSMIIRAFGSEEIDSSIMAETVYKYLVSKESDVAETAGQNSLSLVEIESISTDESEMDSKTISNLLNQISARKIGSLMGDIDSKISSELSEKEGEGTTVEITSIVDLNAWYDSEIKKIEDGIAVLQQEKPDILVETLSAAVIGAVIGVTIGFLVTMIRYMIKLPLLVPEQPQKHLSIRYLGGIRRKKEVFLARLGDKLAGNFLLSSDEKETISIVAANIDELVSENSRILITGTIPLAIVTEFAQKLKDISERKNVEISVAEDINKSAEAIRKLSETDSVILIERLRVSTLPHIKHEQERVNFSGKRILGYVLY